MSQVIKRILCPTDLSEHARFAFLHAITLARWYEARVTALFVVQQTPAQMPGEPYTLSAPLVPFDRDRLLDELREFVKPAAPVGVPVEVELRDGSPVDVILERSSELPADLIVLGTHGHSGFRRLLLGSVTEKILRRASCPVVAVPPSVSRAAAPAPILFRTILCPVDFSPASAAALRLAASLADECDSHLAVLHVLENFPRDEEPPELRHFLPPEGRRSIEQDARARLASFVASEIGAATPCEPIVECGKAHEAILDEARQREAGLIVIGVHGRSTASLLLFGSTTNHVVRAAVCPVLTTRMPPDEPAPSDRTPGRGESAAVPR